MSQRSVCVVLCFNPSCHYCRSTPPLIRQVGTKTQLYAGELYECLLSVGAPKCRNVSLVYNLYFTIVAFRFRGNNIKWHHQQPIFPQAQPTNLSYLYFWVSWAPLFCCQSCSLQIQNMHPHYIIKQTHKYSDNKWSVCVFPQNYSLECCKCVVILVQNEHNICIYFIWKAKLALFGCQVDFSLVYCNGTVNF